MWDPDGDFDAVLQVGTRAEVQARVDSWPASDAYTVTCELVLSSDARGEES